MTEGEREQLEEMEFPELEKLLRCGVAVRKIEPFELNEKKVEPWQIKRANWIKARHMDKYYFSLWYNDMFEWALSWGLQVPTNGDTIEEAEKEFKTFLEKEDVQAILKKFDDVPYPVYKREEGEEYGTYGKREDGRDNLEYYFTTNRQIYDEFVDKLKEFNEYFQYFWVYDKCGW